jgi:Rps23 Pro-64 3,4-dihydroxylase Tpa1-like proline 4-hydroxylase
MLDDAEVVGDEQIGEAEFVLEVHEQVQHLRLHRDVSAETGSSATITAGFSASARAMPSRWRWPPENSKG